MKPNTPAHRKQLIQRKIERTQKNLAYNKVELEFAQKMERDTKLYEKRVSEAQKELEVLAQMMQEGSS